MKKRNSISTYISRLDLPDVQLDEIYEAFSILENYSTDKQKERLAFELFFKASQKLTELMRDEKQTDRVAIGKKLKAAYDNIKTLNPQNMEGLEKQSIKISVWEFLRTLQEEPKFGYEKLKATEFSAFPLLETIKFIFLLKDKDTGNYIFPIGDTLHTIFQSDDLLKFEQKNNENENTFFSIISIALMIFKEIDSRQYKELKEKVKECRLEFLLIEDNGQLNIDAIRANFKANNVLILYTSSPSSKIIIHVGSDNKNYFCGYKNIITEKNPQNGYIFGYHIEIDLDKEDRITSFEEELAKDNIETKKQLIKILFDDNNYNILAKNFLIKKKTGEIVPLNPYSSQDKFIVIDQYNQLPKSNEEPLKKYFATTLVNDGYLNAVTFGTFYLLHRCAPKKPVSFIFDHLSENRCTQNTVINIFLHEYPDTFENLVNIFQNEFKWISDTTEINKKEVNTVKIYPIKPNFDNNILSIFKERSGNYKLKSFKIYKTKIEDGIISLNDKKKENLTPERIDGESINDVMDSFFLVKLGKRLYYFSEYQKLLNEIDDIENNKKLIDEKTLVNIENNRRINDILENIVNLQWKNLYENKNKVFSIRDLCLMRFYYHTAILTRHDKEAITNLIDFYSRIPRITGECIIEKEKHLTSENGLVILKNHQSYGNTATDMLEKYLSNCHKPHPWLQPTLRQNKNKKYCVLRTKEECCEINQITFFFDNSLSGVSTIRTLEQYFLPKESNDKQNMFFFRCNNSNVGVIDIIKQNKITNISVIVMYCTQKAKDKIQEVIGKINKENNITITLTILKQVNQEQEKLEIYAQKAYGRNYQSDSGVFILREFNQPKKNWINNSYFKPEKITSLLIRIDNENL